MSAPRAAPPVVSFVLAAHDEAEALPGLLAEIRAVAVDEGWQHEIVVVDDGSRDGTAALLDDEAGRHGDVVALRHAHNRGQSAALARGLLAARGERLVTLDADGQNDPADAPRLLRSMHVEGADLVTGVRHERADAPVKRWASRVGNAVRRARLHDRFLDVGCQLRAWRPEVAWAIPKFRGFHRFVPVLARDAGFHVVERGVHHRPRRHGRTHYGNLGRAWQGWRDVGVVRALQRRALDLRPPDAQD